MNLEAVELALWVVDPLLRAHAAFATVGLLVGALALSLFYRWLGRDYDDEERPGVFPGNR